MDKIKWGILGCGDVTEVKSGPAFNLVGNSQLHAVMRRNAAKAEDYARRHGVPKWYSNADDLINDPEVNAIYIATPPNVHAELAIKAMKAGKPVYVEKPMAVNFAQCQQMIKVSEETKVPLLIAYYRRALPGFLKVKELIDKGAIGTIRFVQMELYKNLTLENDEEKPWRVNPEIAGAGHFFDLAAHQLDFMDYLFGPVQKISSIAVNQAEVYETEDMVAASFLMPKNIVVNGIWNFTVPKFFEKDTIEIIGTKGKIKFSCFDFIPVELTTESSIETWDFPKPDHVQQFLIEKVVNYLLNKEECPSTGNSGARTSWVMDEVVKAYYKKI
jgi:predicted dehydrogenase